MTPRLHLTLVLAILASLAADRASADWTLYVSAEFGIAKGKIEADGTSTVAGLGSLDFSYDDASPLVGGAVGLETPMNELTPWALPYDLKLPKWPMRFELEAVGLRRYPGIGTSFGALRAFAETKAWTFMFDYWQDVPLGSLNRPIAGMFGKVPGLLRRTLNKTSFFAGAGVGFSSLELMFTDNFHTASEETYNFAWQAGGGFGYALTNAATLTAGYRYFDYGDAESDLIDTNGSVRGPFSLEQTSHEFRAGIRVRIWGFPNPWEKGPAS